MFFLGCTKKHYGTSRARLRICRYELGLEFLEFLRKTQILPKPVSAIREGLEILQFSQLKDLSAWYNERKAKLRKVTNLQSRQILILIILRTFSKLSLTLSSSQL